MGRALLIARGGGVGDTFLATVVAQALKQKYGAVDMLALPAHRSILAGNPYVDNVLEGEGALHSSGYAAAVCTWATLENALVPFRAHIKARVGQARRLYSALFTKRVVIRSELGDRTTHWTQILLDYARALGCDAEQPQPIVALSDADRAEAATVLDRARIDGEFGILHPTRGISKHAERWPAKPFSRLLNGLIERFGIPIVVTGTRAERPLIENIFTEARLDVPSFATRRRSHGVNLAGVTSLRGLTALAARARFVVAMDSGPMHLAASTGTPTLGIFALQSDEPDRWAPVGPRTAIVRATYPCPPSHRKETCPDFACVRDLQIATVIAELERLLAYAPGT